MSDPAPRRRSLLPFAAFMLALAGAAVAIVLLNEHLTVLGGDVAGGLFCGGGGHFDCNTVAAHPSSWLLGLPLAAWGIAFYAAMAGLALCVLGLPEGEAGAAAGAASVLSLAALLLDAWLGWTMVARIHAVCLNCVATYAINVVLAAVWWRLDHATEGRREWRAWLLRWSGPDRWVKLAVFVAAIAAAAAPVVVARRAIAEAMDDARDEATALLQQMATEPAIDMSRFDTLPSEGPADARVTIVVASDFECTFCRALAGRLDDLRAEFPADVRVIFMNVPIQPDCNPSVHQSSHHHACWLAKAGACAARQQRFWQYHRLVYRDLRPEPDEALVRAALPRIGMDPAALDACMTSAETDSAVARDVRTWHELGMKSVPSLIINGHVKQGGIYPTTLRAVVRELLARPR